MTTNTTIHSVLNEIKTAVGEGTWNKLQNETQVGILTSELCYKTFKNDTSFDFSSAIVPLMKGLELELRNTFYEPYLRFVVSNYTPTQYVETNWSENYPGDKKAAELRKKILFFDESRLNFQPLSNEFTIGDFRYTIGASSYYRIHVDETFITFCENNLFRTQRISKRDIIKWLKNLVIEIEGLRQLRNDSSHAGKIQNEMDAKTALDILIKEDKIMTQIISPLLCND